MATDKPESKKLAEMGIFEHLAELRYRLIISIICVSIGAMVAYSYSQYVFALLTGPFHEAFPNQPLIGTGPAEAFTIRLQVAFFSGVLLTSPLLFLQFWLFIAPGLYERERRAIIPFALATTLFFLIGVWFCYHFALPMAYQFCNENYAITEITPMISISELLSSTIMVLLGFGVVFELPVIAFLLGRVGIIDHHTLMNSGRYAIVAIFIISAVLTPPDVMSQLLMAGPLIILYGLSILVLKYTAKGVSNNAPLPPTPIP